MSVCVVDGGVKMSDWDAARASYRRERGQFSRLLNTLLSRP